MRIFSSSTYIPEARMSLPELLKADSLRYPPAEWETTCNLIQQIFTMHGFDSDVLAQALELIDMSALREATGITQVAVERELRMTDMAVRVVQGALEAGFKYGGPERPDTIVVCQTSIDNDHNTNVSAVLRLQCEYGLKTNAFAVGSQDGVSVFTALELLRDTMLTEPQIRYALLCAMERWREPFPRVMGTLTILGDAAAAWLVAADDGPGWHLCDVSVRTCPDPAAVEPWRYLMGTHTLPDFVSPTVSVIQGLLAAHKLKANDVRWVVSPQFNRRIVDQVEVWCGFSVRQQITRQLGEHGYFCAAEPIVRLHEATSHQGLRNGDLAISWACGMQGAAGCALFEYKTK